MSFHLSIIASGRTATPAASVGLNSNFLKGQYAGAAEQPPADKPKDLVGLTLDRVLSTGSISGGFDFKHR